MVQISKSKMAVMVVVLGSTEPAQNPPKVQLLGAGCAKPVLSPEVGNRQQQ